MRKIFFVLTFVLCMLLCLSASAATYTFEDIYATCELSDDYIVLTPDNLAYHPEWLANKGTTEDAMLADYEARGVLLQAWGLSGDVMIEITAVQDLYGEQYYDINQVTSDERKNYRIGHASDKTGEWRALGYDYDSDAAWQNYKFGGRFLKLEYSRTVNGSSYYGLARKTVRNGWHIHVDYQVYDRKPKSSDKSALEAIMVSWEFFEVTARPATSATKIIFTSTPPQETNTGKFTLEGSGSSGMKVLCVAMSMSTREAHQFVAEIDSKGKFKLPVKLPREGFWMLTYTVYNGDIEVEEGAFDGGVTYDDLSAEHTIHIG